MCYGSESVKLGYDSSITPGQVKKNKTRCERKIGRDRHLRQTKPDRGELCVTYQKGIMATVAMDMVTNDNYCYSQRNQYQPPQKMRNEGLHATEPPANEQTSERRRKKERKPTLKETNDTDGLNFPRTLARKSLSSQQ